MPDSLLQRILNGLRLAEQHNVNVMVRPEVILWPDPDRQWEPVIDQVQQHRPGLIRLGHYVPQQLQGPAIYLKCLVGRTLPEADWPAEQIPVIYLPGVSRQMLRPQKPVSPELRPLVEYLYTGTVWLQENGKEWTVLALLTNAQNGLGLRVATDHATRETLTSALPSLFLEDRSAYDRTIIDADFLYDRLLPDVVPGILSWLNEGEPYLNQLPPDKRILFAKVCRSRYGVEPVNGQMVEVARQLGEQRGNWSAVWQYYANAPRKFPAIALLLQQALPDGKPTNGTAESWPVVNKLAEDELRVQLLTLPSQPVMAAVDQLATLARDHAHRQRWVWAELGQAPLATAVQHLSQMADVATAPFPAQTLADMQAYYRQTGHRADRAMRQALASVRSLSDREAVNGIINALYRPWLENLAVKFQALLAQDATALTNPPAHAGAGDFVLFVDALRYELAVDFVERLRGAGYRVELTDGWSALPSLTPTAKPAVSPVAEAIDPNSSFEEFRPALATSGKALTTANFRTELTRQGFAYVTNTSTLPAEQQGWQEIGDIDRKGHEEGVDMVRRVDELFDQLRETLDGILARGVQQVTLVTDHGWLLLPGGLPKADLPAHLTETRWGRCAVVKEGAKTSLLQLPWRWNPSLFVAYAPGVSFFKANEVYAHGGLSLQECFVPMLRIESANAQPVKPALIRAVRWVGMRCVVETENARDGYRLDMRTKLTDASSSVVVSAELPTVRANKGNIFVDDAEEGKAVQLILLNEADQIVAKQLTTVGG
ncbi:BREX-1 system phosphatase PglZ type B [Fibrisoma montanum]|uniref:BREX-1 system phosphatase PglZ type B n=1 Tax=Fibrisoma montanum TaxID=2305895 RepID=A0A418MIS4_9BACT|nr:BREX-1 system phosphatase PglZ type B [Fibrisoma montanum]RIV27365.1 BREX-1 system phosphatase PglZ type B [Fibrisoma montanum]